MNASGSPFEWTDYYDRFEYCAPSLLRAGNYPRAMEHEAPVQRAVVLIHGLTDSPFVMTAVGRYFHEQLGFNVYLPLLHGHGLREPKGMEGISLDEWKKNATYAVDYAASRAEDVSIGGLSMGGALSLAISATHPGVNGSLYLFSAALDLAGGVWGLTGEIKERVLRTPFAKLMEKMEQQRPLVGRNPYRYIRMDNDGAMELGRLIKETDGIVDSFNAVNPFPLRVFAAHSDSDERVHIEGILRLKRITPADRFIFIPHSRRRRRAPCQRGVKRTNLRLEPH